MNKYEVLGVVGEGAYGMVLKCRNKQSGSVVAIKKFKESDEDDILRKTAFPEVKLLHLFRHSNIVCLTEAFRRKGKLFLVFEYVERNNLLEVLKEQPQGLDPALVRHYIFQLCQAIHWCHSNDVVHRDIKPENLLIDVPTRHLKLCDFSFARILTDANEELTDYMGTRWYRAPEMLLGSTLYSFSVDMWAIGCVLGEITDGQPVFPGQSEVDQLYVIQKLLGPLIPHHMDLFMSNPRFAGLKFPDMSRPETLQKKYVGNLSKRAMHFMQGLLSMSPADRPTSEDALNHSYFQGLHSMPHQSDDHSSVGMIPSVPIRGGGGHDNREREAANRPAPILTESLLQAIALPSSNFSSGERKSKLPQQSIHPNDVAGGGGNRQWGTSKPPPVAVSGGGIPSIHSSEDKVRAIGNGNPAPNHPAPQQQLQPQSPSQSKSNDHVTEWDRSSGVEWNTACARSSDNTDVGHSLTAAPASPPASRQKRSGKNRCVMTVGDGDGELRDNKDQRENDKQEMEISSMREFSAKLPMRHRNKHSSFGPDDPVPEPAQYSLTPLHYEAHSIAAANEQQARQVLPPIAAHQHVNAGSGTGGMMLDNRSRQRQRLRGPRPVAPLGGPEPHPSYLKPLVTCRRLEGGPSINRLSLTPRAQSVIGIDPLQGPPL